MGRNFGRPTPHSPELIEEGKWRLMKMLPAARELAKSMRGEGASGLFEAIRPYLYKANLRSLVVGPGQKGGWIADLMLKDVPDGVSNTLGTPVATPFETKFEALETAKGILAMALAEYRPEAPGAPAFLLHHTRITLDQAVLDRADAIRSIWGEHSHESLQGFLRRAVAEAGFEHDCTPELMNQLRETAPDRFHRLLALLHGCAALGLLVWPLRQAKPPGEAPTP